MTAWCLSQEAQSRVIPRVDTRSSMLLSCNWESLLDEQVYNSFQHRYQCDKKQEGCGALLKKSNLRRQSYARGMARPSRWSLWRSKRGMLGGQALSFVVGLLAPFFIVCVNLNLMLVSWRGCFSSPVEASVLVAMDVCSSRLRAKPFHCFPKGLFKGALLRFS